MPTIVYFVSNSLMENWQHVYTAVTRAKSKLVMVGANSHDISAAVRRSATRRNTTLKEKIDKEKKESRRKSSN